MKATLILGGATVSLDETPLDWRGSVVIDGYRYLVLVELVPRGPVFNPSAFGDGYEED